MVQDRLARLGQAMRQHGFEVIALIPGPTLFHLTGLSFHLMERPVVGIFTPSASPCLVLPELELAKAEAAGLALDLIPYDEDEASRTRALQQAAERAGLAGRRVGVEPLRMRVFELRLLEAAAPGASFVSAAEALASLRIVKDEGEVDAMRRAVQVAEAALAATLPLVRQGMTEREFASELTLQLFRAGSDPELPFSPIIASGPNSALPHALPGHRRLQAGDLVVVDWGAIVEGYVSDLTRTFAVGSVDPQLARVHETVQQANAAGRWAVRPGATSGQVDAAARAVIQAAGYGEFFIHRTGHGIGLEGHEPPYIRADDPLAMVPGMTFTVEPGIYLQGRGGVRVEDDMLVTAKGGDSLSSYPREMGMIS
jgi:Xaa-Pro dipeptidase